MAGRVKRWAKNPDFLVILFLTGCLIAGAATFQDFGITWDEPLFYKYADAVPYAYSIRARLQAGYDIERAYGPSVYDHKMYGPPYILVARLIVVGLGLVTQATSFERWHLVNFLFFLVGTWFFYRLSRRWVSPAAGFVATALFATQPLLWGHAFINPKDIPCMVLFIGAVGAGFNLVDASIQGGKVQSGLALPETIRIKDTWPRLKKVLQVAGGVGFLCVIPLLLFSASIRSNLVPVVNTLYNADPNSSVGMVFHRIAPNAASIPVEDYIHKAALLYDRVRTILVVSLAPVALLGALVTLLPGLSLQMLLRWESSALGPLPRAKWIWNVTHMGQAKTILRYAVVAGVFLGAATSIRIIAPMVGFLVGLSFLLRYERRYASGLLVYGLVALLSMIAVWPFLWDAPLARFLEALKYMSNVTNTKPVLFGGQVYFSNDLPGSYFPVLLGITLSEPVWILFAIGLVFSGLKMLKGEIDWRTFLPMQAWFFIPFIYILVRQPPMYDGYRHFLFVLPPVFLTISVAFQAILDRFTQSWLRALLIGASLLPGFLGLFHNHPYQYAYYNRFVGGTGGAFRMYETDFWLTCYKELLDSINTSVPENAVLYVHRQPAIVKEYASLQFQVEQYDPKTAVLSPQNLLLMTTRHNSDLNFGLTTPTLAQVELDGAIFCLVKSLK